MASKPQSGWVSTSKQADIFRECESTLCRGGMYCCGVEPEWVGILGCKACGGAASLCTHHTLDIWRGWGVAAQR